MVGMTTRQSRLFCTMRSKTRRVTRIAKHAAPRLTGALARACWKLFLRARTSARADYRHRCFFGGRVGPASGQEPIEHAVGLNRMRFPVRSMLAAWSVLPPRTSIGDEGRASESYRADRSTAAERFWSRPIYPGSPI